MIGILEHILRQALNQERILLSTSFQLSTTDSSLILQKKKNFELTNIIQLCNILVGLHFIFFIEKEQKLIFINF